MTFCCIASSKRADLAQLLRETCQRRNVNFLHIDPATFSFKTPETNISMLYRASAGQPLTKSVETFLVREGITTFYDSLLRAILNNEDSTLIHQKVGIPMPKTIFLYNQSRSELRESIQELGGFPIIVKIPGKSEGIGVIKVDTEDTFISLTDYLKTTNKQIMLREFIDIGKPPYAYRAIVLGDRVIFCFKSQHTSPDDFRSNANQSGRIRSPVEVSPSDQHLLVNAIRLTGLEFGSVDFVYDQHGQLRVFETNFPFNFGPVVRDMGFPVHEHVVDYLIEKHRKS